MYVQRVRLLATTFFFSCNLIAMEPKSHTFPELLNIATQHTQLLTPDQKKLFTQAVEATPAITLFNLKPLNHETEEEVIKRIAALQKIDKSAIERGHVAGLKTSVFTLLATATQPQEVKMLAEGIMHQTEHASTVFSEQYKEAWAPRTALAAITCCVVSCVKPYTSGLLDYLPSEGLAILITGVWAGEFKERKTQRDAICNGNTVLSIIENKNESLVKERTAVIRELRAQKRNAADQAAILTDTMPPLEKPTQENKKDK